MKGDKAQLHAHCTPAECSLWPTAPTMVQRCIDVRRCDAAGDGPLTTA
jgi:hypothetical protein